MLQNAGFFGQFKNQFVGGKKSLTRSPETMCKYILVPWGWDKDLVGELLVGGVGRDPRGHQSDGL